VSSVKVRMGCYNSAGSEPASRRGRQPNLTALSLGQLGSFPFASAINVVSARFRPPDGYRQLLFFGMLVDVENRSTRFRRPRGVRRPAAPRHAGLELCILKGLPRYEKMRATDPYSVKRYAEHPGLSTNQISES
jgi:hypothetical protein